MTATRNERGYAPDELRALMDSAGRWARSWDDVVGYLHDGANHDTGIGREHATDMIRDVQSLQQENVRFTRDYRKMWQKLTGEDATHLPPPHPLDPYAVDPLEMQGDYFHELEFPCERKSIVRAARLNNAPGRVMERLEALPDRTYQDRDALLEELDDAHWDTTQQQH